MATRREQLKALIADLKLDRITDAVSDLGTAFDADALTATTTLDVDAADADVEAYISVFEKSALPVAVEKFAEAVEELKAVLPLLTDPRDDWNTDSSALGGSGTIVNVASISSF